MGFGPVEEVVSLVPLLSSAEVRILAEIIDS